MRSAESLLKLTEDLHVNFGRINGMESSPHRALFEKWVAKLDAMSAYEHITEEESEEFRLGVNKAYNALDSMIKNSGR
jgi:hypothetical protein